MPDPLRCLCELAKEWLDPTKIPVEEIAEEWRSQSKRGRYKAAMWRTAGLEEPTAKAGRGEYLRSLKDVPPIGSARSWR